MVAVIENPVGTRGTKVDGALAADIVAGLVGMVVVDAGIGGKRERAGGVVVDAAAVARLVVAHDGELGALVEREGALVLEAVALVVADLDHRTRGDMALGGRRHRAEAAATLLGVMVDRQGRRTVDVQAAGEIDARVPVVDAVDRGGAGDGDVASGHAMAAVAAHIRDGAVTHDVIRAVRAVTAVVRIREPGVIDRDLDRRGDTRSVARDLQLGSVQDVDLRRIGRRLRVAGGEAVGLESLHGHT